MKFIYAFVLLLSSMSCSELYAQHFFEKSFTITFPHGQANRVAYLRFPGGPMWGTFEVEISGGYNNDINRGVLRKQFDVFSNGINGPFDAGSEVVAARGPLVNQWTIGEFNNSTFQIPIHHLVSSGNDLVVKVKGMVYHSTVAESIKNSLSISPVSAFTQSTISRSFRSFSEDRIGFGTKTPEYRVDIVGRLRAQEIMVNTQKTADHVFEPAYDLRSIDSVADFILRNKHLPDIPSAKEMLATDMAVGSFQIDLLQKIEELTLYVIDLQKQIRELSKSSD